MYANLKTNLQSLDSGGVGTDVKMSDPITR
jgi:hypothetical protein